MRETPPSTVSWGFNVIQWGYSLSSSASWHSHSWAKMASKVQTKRLAQGGRWPSCWNSEANESKALLFSLPPEHAPSLLQAKRLPE